MASHRKTLETLRAKRDAASSVFCTWAIANGYGQIRNNELASAIVEPEGQKLLAVRDATQNALEGAETAAVHAGHAWRGTYGMIHFYTPAEIRKFSRQGA